MLLSIFRSQTTTCDSKQAHVLNYRTEADLMKFSLTFLMLACSTTVTICHAGKDGSCSGGGSQVLTVSNISKVLDMTLRPYHDNTSCEWLLQAEYPDAAIRIELLELDTECSWDYVFIYDGGSFDSPIVAAYSGTYKPRQLLIHSSKVLIYFFSDLSGHSAGFSLSYELYYANNTDLTSCRSNSDCYQAADSSTKCTDESVCSCDENSVGVFCSLSPVSTQHVKYGLELPLAHLISYNASRPHSLTGQTIVSTVCDSCTNSIWLFGGFDMHSLSNKLYRSSASSIDLATQFTVINNLWEEPGARYSHQMVAQLPHQPIFDSPNHPSETVQLFGEETIYIHGGVVSTNGMLLSDEFWSYSVNARRWTKLPPTNMSLADHCMVILDNRWIFVFGGRSTGTDDNPVDDMYSFDTLSRRTWKKIDYNTGHRNELRLAGHSCNYASGVVYVYGGYTHSEAKFLKLRSTMWLYYVNHRTWSEIQPSPSSGIQPVPLALHRSVLFENKLYVYGGRGGGEISTNCLYQSLLVFDIGCQSWSARYDNFNTTQLKRPSGQIGHSMIAATTRTSRSVLLIYGGLQGSLVSDVFALAINDLLSSSEECGTRNRSDTRCISQSQCTGCVLVGGCHWCRREQVCRAEGTSCQAISWTDNEPIIDFDRCVLDDRPLGWYISLHDCPADLNRPDNVTLIRTTTINWLVKYLDLTRQYCNTSLVAQGHLRSGDGGSVANLSVPHHRTWTLNHRHSNYKLSRVFNDYSTVLSSATTSLLFAADRITAKDALISPDNSSFLRLWAYETASDHATSSNVIGISTNPPVPPLIPGGYLHYQYMEPYTQGPNGCSLYLSCLSCSADISCAWNKISHACVSRVSLTNDLQGRVRLITRPVHCHRCEDFTDCFTCTGLANDDTFAGPPTQPVAQILQCEWLPTKGLCIRRGRDDQAIVRSIFCPTSCTMRTNCSECMMNDECVWCITQSTCLPMDEYLVSYQFGQCASYIEYSSAVPDQCVPCEAHKSCIDCQKAAYCGWCSWDTDPSIGVCISGDFSGPRLSNQTCSSTVRSTHSPGVIIPAEDNFTWSFRQCPDLLECSLNRNNCVENADCIETLEYFLCECRRGYTGLGDQYCMPTCYHDCINGICVQQNSTLSSTVLPLTNGSLDVGPFINVSKDFRCKCNLGWRGEACEVDCECNNHSTCDSGIQKCDRCQDYTRGSLCQECVPRSYGNATSSQGCRPCECHEHGDPARDLCDIDTGVCHCTHHTTGDQCERCLPGYVGDPRHGGECFKCYQGRTYITDFRGSEPFGNTACQLGNGRNTTLFMWIITTREGNGTNYFDSSDGQLANPIAVEMYFIGTGISPSNPIYIYDDIPSAIISSPDNSQPIRRKRSSDQIIDAKNKPIRIIDSSYQQNELIVSESGVISIVYFNEDALEEDEKYQFRVKDLSCPDNCSLKKYNRECNVDGQCVCRGNTTGPLCLPSNTTTCHLDDCSTGLPPRRSFLTARCDDSLYIHGGVNVTDGTILSDLRVVNLTTSAVTSVNTTAYARAGHSGVCLQGDIYIFGGVDESYSITNSLVKLGANGSTVELPNKVELENLDKTNALVPIPGMIGHAVVGFDHTLLILGGWRRYSSSSTDIKMAQSDVMSFDIRANRLELIPTKSNGIYPRLIYSSAVMLHDYRGIDRVFCMDQHFGLIYLDTRVMQWDILRPRSVLPRPVSLLGYTHHLEIISRDDSRRIKISKYYYNCMSWNESYAESPQELTPTDVFLRRNSIFALSDLEPDWLSVIQGVSKDNSLLIGQLELDPPNLCSGFFCPEVCYKCQNMQNSTACISPDDIELFSKTDEWQCTRLCDLDLVYQQYCQDKPDCNSCLVPPHEPRFGIYATSTQIAPESVCKWCVERSKCEPISSISCNTGSGKCPVDPCSQYSGSDCYTCQSADPSCIWLPEISECSFSSTVTPTTCPASCKEATTCSECLREPLCVWSASLGSCLPNVTANVLGVTVAGVVITEADNCLSPCYYFTQCATCLSQPHCGWCSMLGSQSGQGRCFEGGLATPETCNVSQLPLASEGDSSIWSYLTCPAEDECTNQHHTCDPQNKQCINRETGFDCICKDGFGSVTQSTSHYEAACPRYKGSPGNIVDQEEHCVPVCQPDGCGDNGCCDGVNTCSCNLGFVGDNCELQCDCNGNSNCSPDALYNCTECLYDTTGDRCEHCIYGFYRDPTTDQMCLLCNTVCNWRSDTCYDRTLQEDKRTNIGPSERSNVVCVNCTGNSTGDLCETCLPTFYKRRSVCLPCQCNGHSNDNLCDTVGTGCECEHNTDSSDQSNPTKQCNSCNGGDYAGTPTDHRQCYRVVTKDQNTCLDAWSGQNCQEPMSKGSAAYFVINPIAKQQTDVASLHTDVTLYVSVESGALDVYITTSPRIIKSEIKSGVHTISLDSSIESLKDPTYPDLSSGITNKNQTDYRMRKRSTYVGDSLYGDNSLYELTSLDISATGKKSVYYEFLQDRPTVLLIRNMSSRAVIIFSSSEIDFGTKRFYIATQSIEPMTNGKLVFTQNQPTMAMMVFFSAFLSGTLQICCILIIVLKFRQIYMIRQMQTERQVELQTMAARPFSSMIMYMPLPLECSDSDDTTSLGGASNYPTDTASFNVVPLALEPITETTNSASAVATVFMALPGDESRPMKAALATTLLTWKLSNQPSTLKRSTNQATQAHSAV